MIRPEADVQGFDCLRAAGRSAEDGCNSLVRVGKFSWFMT